ncbi:MAG: radical SAM family heme chaperone HemW [Flavobacteriaceae bacterium]|nr:radical SAM family heme chaperone HemW [Flavobacteriaceae bacterium]
MASIYIHIPFCKQACHYCDFHFSTSLKYKSEMLTALCKEITLRRGEFETEIVKSIYFGGGTPSILSTNEINLLIQSVFDNYNIHESVEITLEANPDDLSDEKILELSKTRVNRLSVGVQSFFQKDLKLMNRSHTSSQAIDCIKSVKKHFDNISVDLIYGIPNMDNSSLIENIEFLLSLKINHISAYALTVEPKTALQKYIKKGLIKNVDDKQSQEQFYILLNMLESNGFENYELSNFARNSQYSINNLSYWERKKYIGIGPSAHSFNLNERSWNVKNNKKYIESIKKNIIPSSEEKLSKIDKFNEIIMFGLRTNKGISLKLVENEFGSMYKNQLLKHAKQYISDNFIFLEKDCLYISKKGKFLSDGIASDLFMLN